MLELYYQVARLLNASPPNGFMALETIITVFVHFIVLCEMSYQQREQESDEDELNSSFM